MVRMPRSTPKWPKAAGIEINVNVTPAESFWDDVWLKKPLLTSAWSMRPAGEGLAYPYRAISDVNETHWKRQDYDDLLTKANCDTVDTAERDQALSGRGKLLADEGGVIVPIVRSPGAGAAQGLHWLHPACAELQSELRRYLLREVARAILLPGPSSSRRAGQDGRSWRCRF